MPSSPRLGTAVLVLALLGCGTWAWQVRGFVLSDLFAGACIVVSIPIVLRQKWVRRPVPLLGPMIPVVAFFCIWSYLSLLRAVIVEEGAPVIIPAVRAVVLPLVVTSVVLTLRSVRVDDVARAVRLVSYALLGLVVLGLVASAFGIDLGVASAEYRYFSGSITSRTFFPMDEPSSLGILASSLLFVHLEGVRRVGWTDSWILRLGLPLACLVSLALTGVLLLVAVLMISARPTRPLRNRFSRRVRTRMILGAVAMLALVVASPQVRKSLEVSIVDRSSNIFEGNADTSTLARLERSWQIGYAGFSSDPFFGAGPGNLGIVAERSLPEQTRSRQVRPEGWNGFAWFVGSLGLGGMLFTGAVVLLLARANPRLAAFFIVLMFSTGRVLHPLPWVIPAIVLICTSEALAQRTVRRLAAAAPRHQPRALTRSPAPARPERSERLESSAR